MGYASSYLLRRAIDQWDSEVDVETVRLIEKGTLPVQAIAEAIEIVKLRRQLAAMDCSSQQLAVARSQLGKDEPS